MLEIFFFSNPWVNCNILVNKTSLTSPLLIEVPVPSHESERSWICVLGVSIFLFLMFLHWISELFRHSYFLCYSAKNAIIKNAPSLEIMHNILIFMTQKLSDVKY
jgi:hypothetical protein